MAYDLASLRETISANLGEGAVSVELQEHHYERGIDAALKLLNRCIPMHGYKVIPVAFGGNKYILDIPNMINVVDVTFFNSGGRFEEAPYYIRYADRSAELGDMKSTQRVFNDTPMWSAQPEVVIPPGETEPREVWYLYTNFTYSSFVDTFARLPNMAAVEFVWEISANDDPYVGVSRIPRDLRQWVEDYATARCRAILGDIRGKFLGIPGAADGSLLRNDGSAQVARAEQAIAILERDIQYRRRQVPLVID